MNKGEIYWWLFVAGVTTVAVLVVGVVFFGEPRA